MTAVEWRNPALAELAERLRLRNDLPQPVPTLFHYTTSGGALGILTSGIIRGSNFSFLNDTSEYLYGRNLILERLRDIALESRSPFVGGFVEMVTVRLHDAWENLEVFVTCFSELPDVLSQWRAYTQNGGRYCLGFACGALPKYLQPLPTEVRFRYVLYDSEAQNARVRALIEFAVGFVVDASRGEAEVGIAADLLAEALLYEAAFMKHAGFREEREWRAATYTWGRRDRDLIRFDVAAGVIKPFIHMFNGTPCLPLTEVIVGYAPQPEQARKSIRMLLRATGYDRIDVSSSRNPFYG
jgi:hypothetical protein